MWRIASKKMNGGRDICLEIATGGQLRCIKIPGWNAACHAMTSSPNMGGTLYQWRHKITGQIDVGASCPFPIEHTFMGSRAIMPGYGTIWRLSKQRPPPCTESDSDIFGLIIQNSIWCTCLEIALSWMPQGFTNEILTLVKLMAWCRQALSHYFSQCWLRIMSSCDVTMSLWDNIWFADTLP